MAVEKTKDFSCEDCGKQFKDKLRLSAHMTRNHTENLKKCELCNKEFKRSDHLKAHMSKKHNNQEDKKLVKSKDKNNICSLTSSKKKLKTKNVIGGFETDSNLNISDNDDVGNSTEPGEIKTPKFSSNQNSMTKKNNSQKRGDETRGRGGRLFTPEQLKHLQSAYLGRYNYILISRVFVYFSYLILK